MLKPGNTYSTKEHLFCYSKLSDAKFMQVGWSNDSLEQTRYVARTWSEYYQLGEIFVLPKDSNFLLLEVIGNFCRVIGDHVGWIYSKNLSLCPCELG